MAALVGVMISGAFLIAVFAGPLMASAESGKDELNNVVNQNRTLAIEDEATLSSAAHYVRDRAYGCDQVRDKYNSPRGYSGLEGTPYTKYPPCVDSIRATEVGFFQGALGGYSLTDFPGSDAAGTLFDRMDGGQDMEARHGRIYFEVREEIELTTFKNNYDSTQDGSYNFHLVAISKDDSYRDLTSHCSAELVDASEGTSGYLLAFDGDNGAGAGDRIAFYGDSKGTVDSEEVQEEIENRWLVSSDPYCKEKAVVQAYLSHGQIREYYNGNEGYAQAKLCPGDRGYIQVNKNQPNNFGEADSEIEERGAVGAVFGTSTFPFIQMTHTVDECDNSHVSEPDTANTVDEPGSLKTPEGGWSEVNTRGKELHIEGSSETPMKVDRIDIDNDAQRGNLKGCQIRIEDTATGQVGIVNWSAKTSGDEPYKHTATPIFMDSALPPDYEHDSLDHNLDDKDGAKLIYEKLRFDGSVMNYQLESSPSSHQGAYVRKNDTAHYRFLWRDFLCIDASQDTSQKNGEWVMCGGGDYSYPQSPNQWTCVNGEGDPTKETGWYPTNNIEEGCDDNDPEEMNGYGETGCG